MMDIETLYDFMLQVEKIINLFASVDPLDWRGDCQFCSSTLHDKHADDCVWVLARDMRDRINNLRADQSKLETLRVENRRLQNDLDTLSHAVHGWERERTAHELGEMAVEYNDRIRRLETENERQRIATERMKAVLEKFADHDNWTDDFKWSGRGSPRMVAEWVLGVNQ